MRKIKILDPLKPFPNAKWEAFCHAYARGETQGQSAILAGFASTGAAARGCELAKRPYVQQRIAFLKSQHSKLAIERVSLSKSWVLQELRENILLAKQAEDCSAINRAIELIGKELGMFVERKILGIQDIRSASADDLFNILSEIDSAIVTRQIAPVVVETKALPESTAPATPPPALTPPPNVK